MNFKQWLLKEDTQGVKSIFTEISNGRNLLLNWTSLLDSMKEIGNDVKADYLDSYIRRNQEAWEAQAPDSRMSPIQGLSLGDQRATRNMIVSGTTGFCTPDDPTRYQFFTGDRKPWPFLRTVRVTANVPFGEQLFKLWIPVADSVVNSAIRSQMGVAQFLRDSVRPEQVDLGGSRIVDSYDNQRSRISFANDLDTLTEIRGAVSRALESGKLDIFEINFQHRHMVVSGDIEEYQYMLSLAGRLG